ncbi:MAG: 4-phosphoerythronate dehydrogenase [Prevotellaceae bacterium]|jgi:erythronate-4-phosphate dehydrogenase|nr:4-phosphoerythronate dehydrogenase [Prevotellaceae bacterium]
MKIVIDEDIPFIKGVFEPYMQVCYLLGKQITRNDVKDADALVVRTRTKCNTTLLKDSKVKYIASATIGYDHIDTVWCNANGIKWSNAVGCNANSVGQYILAALLEIARRKQFELSGKTIGIVGVGHVGSAVNNIAGLLNMRVLLNDPPREELETKAEFTSIDTIAREADIISFHTPLTREGRYKTYHLFDDAFAMKLKPGAIIINSSRGEVIDENALKKAIGNKQVGATVLDVWKNEPDIDKALLSLVDIATPHIAGYSTDGKAKATEMSVQSVSRFFALPLNEWTVKELPLPGNTNVNINFVYSGFQQLLQNIIPISYDILTDDSLLHADSEIFEYLRKTYRVRREFPYYSLVFNKMIHFDEKMRLKLECLGYKVLQQE